MYLPLPLHITVSNLFEQVITCSPVPTPRYDVSLHVSATSCVDHHLSVSSLLHLISNSSKLYIQHVRPRKGSLQPQSMIRSHQ